MKMTTFFPWYLNFMCYLFYLYINFLRRVITISWWTCKRLTVDRGVQSHLGHAISKQRWRKEN